jgi:hypothetical protein
MKPNRSSPSDVSRESSSPPLVKGSAPRSRQSGTGLKRQDLHGKRSVEFEGGEATVVNIEEKLPGGGVLLYLDINEGGRPHILLYGKYDHYGAGLEFVETAPRRYW